MWSFVTQRQHESCNLDLTLFKQNSAEWLSPHNSFIVDYYLNLATRWPLITMKQEMIKILLLLRTKNKTLRNATHYTQIKHKTPGSSPDSKYNLLV